MLAILANSFRVPEIRKKLAFTAAMLMLYRLGAYIPAPGINIDAVDAISDNFSGSNVLGFLNLFSGGSLQRFAIFALGIMPYITASIILQLMTVVLPSLEKLRKEGEVGQQKITQYTRYLTVAPRVRPVGRLRLPLPLLQHRLGPGRRELHVRPRLPDRHLPHGGLRDDHVVRRADHAARDRQRHLADDLRVDRRRAAERDPGVVDEPGSDLQGDDALHRARDHRGDRVHAGGPAADPDPVREARGRAPDGRRRVHLPAAAREHGRRDPGDLRRLADGVPADGRRADAGGLGPGLLGVLLAERSRLPRSASPSSSSSSPTSTPPSRSTRWSRRTTSRSTAASYRG